MRKRRNGAVPRTTSRLAVRIPPTPRCGFGGVGRPILRGLGGSGFMAWMKKEGRRDRDALALAGATTPTTTMTTSTTTATVAVDAVSVGRTPMLELVCASAAATAGINPGPWSAWWPTGVFRYAAMAAPVVTVTRLLPTLTPRPPPPSVDTREDGAGTCTREEGRACRSRLGSEGDQDPRPATT